MERRKRRKESVSKDNTETATTSEAVPKQKRPRPAVIDLCQDENDQEEVKYIHLAITCPGWISWPNREGAAFDDWMKVYRPSKTSRFDCQWLSVVNVNSESPGFVSSNKSSSFDPSLFTPILANMEKRIEREKRISTKVKQEVVSQILKIASDQKYTNGKWMLFLSRDSVDAVWSRVATAVKNGNLGCAAKVAPALEAEGGILICVYVNDFQDRKQVARVLRALEKLHNVQKISFKPDIFTRLEINSNNKWRLPPTIYKASEVMMEWEEYKDLNTDASSGKER